jgi:transposase-like protein
MAMPFSKAEREILQNNPFVQKVTGRTVTFTTEFKMDYVARKSVGESSRAIFKSAGIDPDILGERRINTFTSRMKQHTARPEGFRDLRSTNSGRHLQSVEQDELTTLRNEVAYLRQENTFLKKVDLIDRKSLWQRQQ